MIFQMSNLNYFGQCDFNFYWFLTYKHFLMIFLYFLNIDNETSSEDFFSFLALSLEYWQLIQTGNISFLWFMESATWVFHSTKKRPTYVPKCCQSVIFWSSCLCVKRPCLGLCILWVRRRVRRGTVPWWYGVWQYHWHFPKRKS